MWLLTTREGQSVRRSEGCKTEGFHTNPDSGNELSRQPQLTHTSAARPAQKGLMVTEIKAAVLPPGFDLRNVGTSSLQRAPCETGLFMPPKTLILSAESVSPFEYTVFTFAFACFGKEGKKNILAFTTSITGRVL